MVRYTKISPRTIGQHGGVIDSPSGSSAGWRGVGCGWNALLRSGPLAAL